MDWGPGARSFGGVFVVLRQQEGLRLFLAQPPFSSDSAKALLNQAKAITSQPLQVSKWNKETRP